MQTFYIDTSDGLIAREDNIGIELLNVDAARRAAVAALPGIAGDVIPDGDDREFVATVKDSTGKPILRAKLTLSVEWL
jgi:hypothetical protein